MASVNLCDRCPSMVKGLAVGGVTIATSSDMDTVENIRMELCPACIAELVVFLETTPNERPQRAYDKPYVRPRVTDPSEATAEQLAAQLFEKLMQQNNTRAIGGGE